MIIALINITGDLTTYPTGAQDSISFMLNCSINLTQKIPAQSEPSVLLEGHVYEAGSPPIDSHLAHMRFTIRNSAFVRLDTT